MHKWGPDATYTAIQEEPRVCEDAVKEGTVQPKGHSWWHRAQRDFWHTHVQGASTAR